MEVQITNIKYDEKGLVPAIVQDVNTGKVLMLAYMNKESLQTTLETGRTWFYSRSRQRLWNKGETSGHIQEVQRLTYDCDGDALLVEVQQTGPACHTGELTCFHNRLHEKQEFQDFDREIIHELYNLIVERKSSPIEGSYTNYLFTKGIDKILKKIAEESGEVIIAAKNPDKGELVYELSDLIYHALVLMVEKEVTIEDLKQELRKRRN